MFSHQTMRAATGAAFSFSEKPGRSSSIACTEMNPQRQLTPGPLHVKRCSAMPRKCIVSSRRTQHRAHTGHDYGGPYQWHSSVTRLVFQKLSPQYTNSSKIWKKTISNKARKQKLNNFSVRFQFSPTTVIQLSYLLAVSELNPFTLEGHTRQDHDGHRMLCWKNYQ